MLSSPLHRYYGLGWLGGVLHVMVKFLRVAKYFRNCLRYCAFSQHCVRPCAILCLSCTWCGWPSPFQHLKMSTCIHPLMPTDLQKSWQPLWETNKQTTNQPCSLSTICIQRYVSDPLCWDIKQTTGKGLPGRQREPASRAYLGNRINSKWQG